MVTKMATVKAAELVEDFSLYPRSQVDGAHVQRMADAVEAGEKLPPIIIDAESKRIIDGFHRRRAYIRARGDDADIRAELRTYADEKEMYLEAMRLNARHGKGITGSEQTGAILKAMAFKIEPILIASSLGITQERVGEIVQNKSGKVRQGRTATGSLVALKRSAYHLAGKTLTADQAEAMDMFPGQSQTLLIRQLIRIIETQCVDLENDQVVSELVRLREILDGMRLERTA